MTLIENLLSQSKQGKKELARQELIVSVTEQIWAALESACMSKADLARSLETSKSNVTQLLDGQRNMTLSTLADIGGALGVKPHVVLLEQNTTAFISQGSYQGRYFIKAATTAPSPLGSATVTGHPGSDASTSVAAASQGSFPAMGSLGPRMVGPVSCK
jgi:DNA-binding Xre family transcriptional regulator